MEAISDASNSASAGRGVVVGIGFDAGSLEDELRCRGRNNEVAEEEDDASEDVSSVWGVSDRGSLLSGEEGNV